MSRCMMVTASLLLAACGPLTSEQTDMGAPQVAITTPVASAVVKGQVTILASAIDDFSVVSVKFFIDNVLIQEDAALPYSAIWQTSGLQDGTNHVIRAEARDPAGHLGLHQITVQVDNSRQ